MAGSATPHLRIAWCAFEAHWRVFVLATLVLFGAWAGLELAVATLHRLGVALNVVLHLAFLVLFSGLMVGFHGIALQAIEGRAPTLKDLTGLLARGPTVLLAWCLYCLAVAAGLVLLVVPGVHIAVRYSLFGHVLASRQASALDALREAGSLAQGRWWALCRCLLAVAALNLAGAAILGLGLFISLPVGLLATASLFRALQRQAGTGQGGAGSLLFRSRYTHATIAVRHRRCLQNCEVRR
jgi:hypothetical protein